MFCIVTFGTTQIGVAVKVHFIKYVLKNILNACEKPLHLKKNGSSFFNHNSLQKQIIYILRTLLSATPPGVKKIKSFLTSLTLHY